MVVREEGELGMRLTAEDGIDDGENDEDDLHVICPTNAPQA
jgi:hypothetical protein